MNRYSPDYKGSFGQDYAANRGGVIALFGDGVATTVMALGDSITLGSNTEMGSPFESYRAAAKTHCDAFNYPVTWVGPENDSQTYDHNGVSGHFIYEIADELDAHIDDDLAEVLVVCAGANDVMLETSGGEPANMITALGLLLDLTQQVPGVKHVILTDIPVQDNETEDCEAFNALLPTLAATYPNVTFAPIFGGVELDDGVHPTEAGYNAAGVALGPVLRTVLAGLSSDDVARSPAQLSARQQFASTAIRDFWLSVKNEDGDGLGAIYEDASNTDPAEDGDVVASATDLINAGDWNVFGVGPPYDDDGSLTDQPVLDFSDGFAGLFKATQVFGTPCTVWFVGETGTDSYGYLMQWSSAGSARVPIANETFGAAEDGFGFFDGAHKSYHGDDGTDHTGDYAFWCFVFSADGNARMYRNGVQEGSATAYTSWGGTAAAFYIGRNASPIFKASDLGGLYREVSDAEIAALATYFADRYSLS